MTQQTDYTGAPIYDRPFRGAPRPGTYYVGPSGATDPKSASARRMAAKFAGKCPLCKGEIAVGAPVVWEPGRRAIHQACPVVEPAPAPAPAPVVEPEADPLAEEVQPQVVLARVAADFTDEQLERAYSSDAYDDLLIRAVLDAELDARNEAEWAASLAAAPVAPVAPVVVPAPAPVASEPVRLGQDAIGIYVLPNGDVVKVQANREKTKTYAKRWTKTGQDRLMDDGHHAHGEYVYEPGLVNEVARTGRKMTFAEAKAHSVLYGQCVRCGRALKDGKSVEQGMGPVCVKYFS